MAFQAKSRLQFQAFAAFSLMALFLSLHSRADEVITPADGKGWGEGATTESLLNMKRDPEVVRIVDPDNVPIQVKGSCMDDKGRTYTGEDEEYSQCMNRKSARTKAAAPASVSVKK